MISKLTASAIYSKLGNNSSLVPLGIKDVANSCGLTTASYIAGDKVEGKDRFIDEFGTQSIWLFGIPSYKYAIDKTLFKMMKLDSEIDPRIFKDKKILDLAVKYAPSKEIANNIKSAIINQKTYKNLSMAKFIISTGLTALSYFGLTKFRHNYTEEQIKKDYIAKHGNLDDYKGVNIPFSSAFDSVHKNKNISFTGGIQDFMFNPVKNLMIVDGVITGERLSHSRNTQDFTGYAIKEGSFWLFMYGAGKIISDALEKHTENKYKKSIDLDARVIENDKFKQAFADGSLKNDLEAFKKISGSKMDIYEYGVNPKTKNLIIEMAKISDVIPMLKKPIINLPILGDIFKEKTDFVDTRKFINPDDIENVANKINKLLNQFEESGEDIDTFFTSLRKLKRSSVCKNIGACIAALGVIAPAIMLAVRKFGNNSEYQVKKDVEAKLNNVA